MRPSPPGVANRSGANRLEKKEETICAEENRIHDHSICCALCGTCLVAGLQQACLRYRRRHLDTAKPDGSIHRHKRQAAGAGYNVDKHNSIIGEFMWSGMPTTLG